MKKFTLSILAVLVTAFVMTSCIDNAVSKEVKDLRAAQVLKVNAQTALINADVAYRTAQVAYQAALTAHQVALTAAQTITNNAALLAHEIAVAQAEATFVTAEHNLEIAINALAKYVAEYGTKEAATILTSYNTAAGNVSTYAAEVATKVKLIAGLELFYKAGAGNNAYYATIREWYERDLADAELKLANAEAALEIILAVEADPASAAAQLADVNASIQDLDNLILEQAIVIAPLQTASTDAAAATATALTAKNKEDGLVSAINKVKAAVTKNNTTKLTQATDSATTALSDANKTYKNEIAQLAPYVASLEATFASAGIFVDSLANLEQAVRVSTNALKVARAQENIATGSATAVLTKANASVTNVITRVKAISGRSNVDMPYIVTDETTYPGYVASVAGTYVLSVTALTAAMVPAVNDTYTMGGVTYTIMATAPAIGDVFIRVSGKGDPAITGGTLVKATGAATVNITVGAGTYTTLSGTYVDGTLAGGSVAGSTLLFAINKQNNRIEQDEVDALKTALINTDLVPANAKTTTALSTAYGSSTAVYGAVTPFFANAGANPAYVLVQTIGKLNLASFMTDFADKTKANGVFSKIATSGTANATWLAVKAADDRVVTVTDYYPKGIKVGDASKDGVNNSEDLDEAYATIVAYSASDSYTKGGETDALAMETAALASQAAALAAYTPLKTASDAAAAALTAAQKVSDAVTGYNKQRNDLLAVKTAIDAFIAGANLTITTFKNNVETAQSGVDSAEKALADLGFDEDEIAAQIVYEQERLTTLQAKLVAAQEIAANWLALLNDALGN